MSVKIANLVTRAKKITVKIGGETINVTYNPGVITQKWLNDGRPVTEALPEAIKEWDIEGEDGETVPVSEEGFKLIPFDVINLIWAKIVRDVSAPHEDAEKKD